MLISLKLVKIFLNSFPPPSIGEIRYIINWKKKFNNCTKKTTLKYSLNIFCILLNTLHTICVRNFNRIIFK